MKVDKEKIKQALLNLLRSQFLKMAFKWIGKKFAWAVTGPWGWVLDIVLTKVWNMYGDQAARWLWRKGALGVDLADGGFKARRIDKAVKEGDIEEYDQATDDLFDK